MRKLGLWWVLLAAGCESFTLDRETAGPTDGAADATADAAADVAAVDSTASGDTSVIDASPPDSPATEVMPDAGCRCGDPGCCPGVDPIDCCSGATCPVAHSNGPGKYWFCGPLGVPGNPATYTKEMALAAAKAWRKSGTVTEFVCGTGGPGSVENALTTSDPRSWWSYTGSAAGHYSLVGGGAPLCPTTASPTWD
ncbi:MAG: hypothetical protein IPJ34_43095 [Myxococcales bacterium]|nr:hypothetical protein [Myxococcales bacterium]